MTMSAAGSSDELRRALLAYRGPLLAVALISAAVNLLMLTGPLFMLQVHDRVLASRSTATLAALFGIAAYLFAVMGLLDYCRGRVLARIGAGFQARLDRRVFDCVLRQGEAPRQRARPATALRDLSAIGAILSSPGMAALFDLPWTPVFILLLFVFHPWLGWLALSGSLLVLSLAVLNRACSRRNLDRATRLAAEAEARGEAARQGLETVRGLGMTGAMSALWAPTREAALTAWLAASDIGGAIAAITRTARFVLQSAVLGLGALLVLRGELSPGAMVAGSILLGRALAPVDQTVAHWPDLQRAFRAWNNLSGLLGARPPARPPTPLPRPKARLEVRDLVLAPPGETRPVLQGITFQAEGGDAIAVIGPSAAGKSSLARAVAGLWPPRSGEVRLGGATLDQYDPDRLGRYLGYLAQDVVLFPGSVAQNIARFDPGARAETVVAAARQAAAHEMILRLPRGYDTPVADGDARLSGGQRQRIGLARAFHGDPVLLVLDEPNASLDDAGLRALDQAIANARASGCIVLVMSHRPSALAGCNKVLVLEGGRMRAFGPRDAVLRRFFRPVPPAAAAASGRR